MIKRAVKRVVIWAYCRNYIGPVGVTHLFEFFGLWEA